MPSGTPFDRHALRRARLAAGLTQHQLAVTAGVSGAGRVGTWESGRAAPSVVSLVRLAQALGLSASELLLSEDERRGELQAVRLSLGLSAAQVADAAGMPRSSYLRWEHGNFIKIPSHAALNPLAAVFGIGVDRMVYVMERTRRVASPEGCG